MHPMTAANLRNAYGGESMAHMRYGIWGDKAEKDGYPNVARLFRAIASAETVHATGHFRELGSEPGDALCASGAVFGLGPTSRRALRGASTTPFRPKRPTRNSSRRPKGQWTPAKTLIWGQYRYAASAAGLTRAKPPTFVPYVARKRTGSRPSHERSAPIAPQQHRRMDGSHRSLGRRMHGFTT